MEFKKSFTEAAQQAILVKLADGTWENLPWLAQHVQDVISDGVAAMLVTTEGVMQPIDLSGKAIPRNAEFSSKKTQFVDWEGKEVPADREATSGKTIKAVVGKGPVVEIPPLFEFQSDLYPGSFLSEDFSWKDGFPFKIMVTLRDKSQGKGYCIHYESRPSYEEFDQHFQLTRARTHNVFIRQADGSNSWDITDEMLTRPAPKETFTSTDEWPEGKTHRIKFHDQRTGSTNYVYFDYRPSGIILKKYHHKKGFAVVQQRPEGV